MGSRWASVLRALRSPVAKRIYLFLAVVLFLFLWANMVRRAVAHAGSQYDDFVGFSRDLIFRDINVYEEYPEDYTITKYPPFFGFLLAPFVPLPPALGAALWFLLNFGLAAGATYLSVATVDERSPERRRPFSLYLIPFVLASGIIGSNLETAQVNILILFFLCLALYAFRTRRDLAAGGLLGLITALKLTPGLFILYFAYKRAGRVVVGALLGLVVCWLVLPPAFLGFGDFLAIMRAWYADLIPFVTQGTLAEGIEGFRHTNQSLSAALHRFLTATPAGAGRTDFYVNLMSLDRGALAIGVKVLDLAILGLLAWLCRASIRDRADIRLAFEYALVMMATLFVSPISWINHYVLILFPFAVGVYYVRSRPRSSGRRRLMLWVLGAAFVLISSSASRLMQAFSIPFLGLVTLAAGFAVLQRRELTAPSRSEGIVGSS